MPETIYSIYLITNKVNGKKYIGLTKVPSKRFGQHKRYSRQKDKSKLQALHHAFLKYGEDSFVFEIIHTNIKTFNSAVSLEMFYINKYNTFKEGYNLSLGGEGCSGFKLTKEQKLKQMPFLFKPGHTTNIGRKRPDLSGENNHNTKLRKTYRITYETGKTETITGLKKFAKSKGYNCGHLSNMSRGRLSRHKDIIGIEEIISSSNILALL